MRAAADTSSGPSRSPACCRASRLHDRRVSLSFCSLIRSASVSSDSLIPLSEPKYLFQYLTATTGGNQRNRIRSFSGITGIPCACNAPPSSGRQSGLCRNDVESSRRSSKITSATILPPTSPRCSPRCWTYAWGGTIAGSPAWNW